MSYLLGIDYGTSKFKVHLFDTMGNPIGAKAGVATVERPLPGWVEQNVEKVWEHVCESIHIILKETQVPANEIDAVGITGTSNICILDRDGKSLRPAILYGDTRLPRNEEIQDIQSEIGAALVGADFGFDDLDEAKWTIILRLLATSKLLWLRHNEPAIFKQINACLISSWDYLNFRLSGKITHWAKSFEVDKAIAELFGIPWGWFGTPIETGEIIGKVNAKGARESGLTLDTPIVLGGMDSLCMFLGSGMTKTGMALNAAGTTDVVVVTTGDRPQAAIGYPVEHLIPGLWMLSLSPVRGPTLNWFRELLLPRGASFQDLDNLAAQAPPGSRGLLCLPYFSGEKGIVHDPNAKGVLVGLDLQHGKAHMARSVLEGIAYSTRQILDVYRQQGYEFSEIRLCGGGAGSALWNQIKADILGQNVHVVKVLDSGCLGAAIVAAVALGNYPDRKQASDSMVRVGKVFSPSLEAMEIYDKLYQSYEQLYPIHQSIFQDLSAR